MKNEITYIKVGDYYIPDVTIPGKRELFLGHYGTCRLIYIMKHKKPLYSALKMNLQVGEHCFDVEKQARRMEKVLIKHMIKSQNVTEELKQKNQMEWVGKMNNIKNSVHEIILRDLIYV
ncbi:MAG: TnpV protein [Oscillospiraceae bacterium]|nr:TnpV protein [Oscillospiraceae bacterium]